MPTQTYTPLATVTLGTAASSVTFSSIPATYRDLILVVRPIGVSTTNQTGLRFNGDTGTNYPTVLMFGNGSTTGSFTSNDSYIDIKGGFTSGIGVGIAQIMDYSASDKHKTVLIRKDEPASTAARAGRWANTAVVTSLSLTGFGSNLDVGSRFDLYGVIA